MTQIEQLSRRRVNRWPILLAMVLAGGAWLSLEWPEARRRGWLWLVPDRVLFESISVTGYASPLGHELQRRLGVLPWRTSQSERTLGDESVAALVRRAARGNVFARPISTRWQDSYGVVLQDLYTLAGFNREWMQNQANLNDYVRSPVIKALEEIAAIPASVGAAGHAKWPRDPKLAVPIHLASKTWWPEWWGEVGRVEWTATNHRGESAQGTASVVRGSAKLDVTLAGHVTITGIAEFRPSMGSGPWPQGFDVSTPGFEFQYSTVDTIDEVLPPLVDPKLDKAMETVAMFVRRVREHDVVEVRAAGLANLGYDDVAFGVRATMRSGGQDLLRVRLAWRGDNSDRQAALYLVDYASPEYRKMVNAGFPPDTTVTLTSDPARAIYVDGATRYWSGEVTFPYNSAASKSR
ncbi:MAG: hypothetical protein U0638_08575 [Phycisphaerales bacterium]